MIGTIEDVNRKIGKLEQRLQSYTQLVVESRASDRPDSEFHPTSARGRIRYLQKGKSLCFDCLFYYLFICHVLFCFCRVLNISCQLNRGLHNKALVTEHAKAFKVFVLV